MAVKKATTTGTTKTEIFIGSAQAKLSAAVAAAKTSIEELGKLDASLEEKVLQHQNVEAQILEAKQNLDNALAQNKVTIELDFKANQSQFVKGVLEAQGLTTIEATELAALNAKLAQLKTDFDTEVRSAIGKERGMMEASYKAQERTLQLEYSTKEAQNLARITSLEERITFLSQQCADWQKALDAERSAGVQRAQASAIGSVNVTSGKG